MLRFPWPSPSALSTRIAAGCICALVLYFLHRRQLYESYAMGFGESIVEKATVWRETRYVGGVAGTTLWENIYLHNGTFHVISTSSLPEPGYIMSASPDGDDRPPAGEDRWRVVDRDQAIQLMGKEAVQLSGTSFLFNDESSPNLVSFLGHYFHFAEVFLAAWRVTSSFYGAEIPKRIMFRTTPDVWQDPAGLVNWIHGAILPHTSIMDLPKGTVMFDKLVIVDRFATHHYGSDNITKWNAMTMDIKDLKVSDDWMEPLREALATHLYVERKPNPIPVVTYLNRQKTGRRLRERDAEELILELEKLATADHIVLHDCFFEDVSHDEQFSLILNTDILLGVHGNGLTHQMWMRPGSAVVEIMGEGGFAIIFPWLADLMKHKHLAVHYDHIFKEDKWTLSDGSALGQDGDFRSDHIRVSGTFVAGLIKDLASPRIL